MVEKSEFKFIKDFYSFLITSQNNIRRLEDIILKDSNSNFDYLLLTHNEIVE